MDHRRRWYLGIALSLLVPAFVIAGTVPYTFTAGTPIRAAEVNANFAATPNLSGSRLAHYGLVSGDGLRLPQPYASTGIFDTQLGVYCQATLADDGKIRCLPTSASSAGYRDSSCSKSVYTRAIYFPFPSPSWPTETAFYIVESQSDAGLSTFQPVATTQRYEYGNNPDGGGYGCSLIPLDAGVVVYAPGATVSASQFVEFTIEKL